MQPYSRVKKTPDFIGRNRRAVRNTGRERGKETGPKAPGQRKRERANDTVEISKSSLDRLLQMCVAPQHSAGSTTFATPHHVMPTASDAIAAVPHIQPERNQIPGPWPAPSTDGLDKRPSQVAATLSPHDQWLSDLAQQRNEQAVRREKEKLKKRTEDPPEEYFPWGRPGGGAPIRSVSGTLLTNYSTRSQAVENMRNSSLHHALDGRTAHAPEHAPAPQKISPYKSQFARGMGPHVDNFVLSQREEQRRKDLMHKEQLEAQIAEKRRQREAEQRRHELEEREAELRVKREIEEMNKRNERERQRQRQKAEEEKAMLQARIEEAEETAQREKLEQQRKVPAKRELPSRIPLPIKPGQRPPPTTQYKAGCRAEQTVNNDSRAAGAMQKTLPKHTVHQSINQRYQEPSPPLPAVARAMVGRLTPAPPHSNINPQHLPQGPASHHPPQHPPHLPASHHPPQHPPHPPASHHPPQHPPHLPASHHPPQPPLSPIVPALAKKLALQTNPQPHNHSIHPTTPPLQQPHSTPRHSPSCLSSHPPPLPNLTPSQEHTGMKFPTHPPHVVARQQTILHQLAILREGILSQRNAVDTRLQQKFQLTPFP